MNDLPEHTDSTAEDRNTIIAQASLRISKSVEYLDSLREDTASAEQAAREAAQLAVSKRDAYDKAYKQALKDGYVTATMLKTFGHQPPVTAAPPRKRARRRATPKADSTRVTTMAATPELVTGIYES